MDTRTRSKAAASRPRPRRWLWAGGADGLALTALAVLAIGGCSSTPDVERGQQAPDFTLVDDEGQAFRLSDRLAAGKIVVLSFYPQDDTPG